jgi:hypothetical protein
MGVVHMVITILYYGTDIPSYHYMSWRWNGNMQVASLFESCATFTVVQVQVQVCFTSACGQVQPLDVALSNSVRHKSCNRFRFRFRYEFTSVDGQVQPLDVALGHSVL